MEVKNSQKAKKELDVTKNLEKKLLLVIISGLRELRLISTAGALLKIKSKSFST